MEEGLAHQRELAHLKGTAPVSVKLHKDLLGVLLNRIGIEVVISHTVVIPVLVLVASHLPHLLLLVVLLVLLLEALLLLGIALLLLLGVALLLLVLIVTLVLLRVSVLHIFS